MEKIGFLGCGKIGKALLEEARQLEDVQTVFVQDIVFEQQEDFAVIKEADPALYEQCDLIIECATANVLKQNIDEILKYSNLLMFSVTAFADPEFEEKVRKLTEKYQRQVFIPHGAILGLDGLFDGRRVWEKISIETTKNPKSLSVENKEREVLFQGKTRDACKLFPRNVNVHAAVALAGLGFDRTESRIVSDPSVNTNSHIISMEGEGVSMQIHVSSFTTGGVTGKYTPYSACGSLRRILENRSGLKFV